MKNYSIDFENRIHGMIELIHSVDYTGTKTGAIKEARRIKQQLESSGISKFRVHYIINER